MTIFGTKRKYRYKTQNNNNKLKNKLKPNLYKLHHPIAYRRTHWTIFDIKNKNKKVTAKLKLNQDQVRDDKISMAKLKWKNPHLYQLYQDCANNTYAMPTNRTFRSYKSNFSHHAADLKKFVKELFYKNKKVVEYLDCGAGQGNAIKQFIKGGNKGEIIIKATGISLHPFIEIPKLIGESEGRVEWYFERGNLCLPKLRSDTYDLITDLWGIYFYSTERLQILSNIYRILKPGGKAFITIGCRSYSFFISDRTRKEYGRNLEQYLCHKWPLVFSYHKSHRYKFYYLQISKSINNPIPNNLISLEELTVDESRTKNIMIRNQTTHPVIFISKKIK